MTILRTITPARSPARGRAFGLSIIELMVGLVVGLLVSLAAVSSAQLFTAAQRQGVGTNSGGANAASALASIKNDLSNGGLGFFGNLSYLCDKLNFSVATAAVSDGAAFAPVAGSRPAGATNDTLDVSYGSDVIGGVAVRLSSSSDGTSASLKSLLPVAAGQAVLLAPVDITQPCVIRTVTAVAAPTSTTKEVLTFGAAGPHNQVAFGTAPVYPTDSQVALMGTLRWNRYSVSAGNLQLTNVLSGATVTLLRNVVGFRVLYGVSAVPVLSALSTGNTGSVIAWQKTTDAGWTSLSSANVSQVKAIRIAVVVRSAQPEKAESDGVCRASTGKPELWADLGITPDVIEPDVSNWQCYRYRTQIVVAPMRNIVFGQ